jgi:hypothetical protein
VGIYLLVKCSSSRRGGRPDGTLLVNKYFAEWPLRRPILALSAAYAIALSGIIASFGAGRALAATPNSPGAVTCHTEIAAETSPAGEQDNGNACTASCCIGCLTFVAALPPPPAEAAGVPQSPGQILPPPTASGLALAPQTKFHQSRAPPFDV